MHLVRYLAFAAYISKGTQLLISGCPVYAETEQLSRLTSLVNFQYMRRIGRHAYSIDFSMSLVRR